MSTVHHLGTRSSGLARCARPRALARSALARVAHWVRQEYEFRRSTAALRELDDRLLADIGLTRVSADHYTRREAPIIAPDERVHR